MYQEQVKSGTQMPNVPDMNLLLDTHTWVWLNNGSDELSNKIIQKIDTAADQGKVFISAISVWEIATLAAKKRLVLRTSLKEWVDEALSQVGVDLVPLSPDISIESSVLPNGFHGDPADRLIVATARIKRMILLTRDSKILSYAKEGFLQAVEV